eukprot:scaffold1941_cov263-Pinguiococcus_pyrenoidosus.AAC.20
MASARKWMPKRCRLESARVCALRHWVCTLRRWASSRAGALLLRAPSLICLEAALFPPELVGSWARSPSLGAGASDALLFEWSLIR